jgi:hypothetical protein
VYVSWVKIYILLPLPNTPNISLRCFLESFTANFFSPTYVECSNLRKSRCFLFNKKHSQTMFIYFILFLNFQAAYLCNLADDACFHSWFQASERTNVPDTTASTDYGARFGKLPSSNHSNRPSVLI